MIDKITKNITSITYAGFILCGFCLVLDPFAYGWLIPRVIIWVLFAIFSAMIVFDLFHRRFNIKQHFNKIIKGMLVLFLVGIVFLCLVFIRIDHNPKARGIAQEYITRTFHQDVKSSVYMEHMWYSGEYWMDFIFKTQPPFWFFVTMSNELNPILLKSDYYERYFATAAEEIFSVECEKLWGDKFDKINIHISILPKTFPVNEESTLQEVKNILPWSNWDIKIVPNSFTRDERIAEANKILTFLQILQEENYDTGISPPSIHFNYGYTVASLEFRYWDGIEEKYEKAHYWNDDLTVDDILTYLETKLQEHGC